MLCISLWYYIDLVPGWIVSGGSLCNELENEQVYCKYYRLSIPPEHGQNKQYGITVYPIIYKTLYDTNNGVCIVVVYNSAITGYNVWYQHSRDDPIDSIIGGSKQSAQRSLSRRGIFRNYNVLPVHEHANWCQLLNHQVDSATLCKIHLIPVK